MKREIRLVEAVGIMITIISSIFIAYVNIKGDIRDHTVRIEKLEGSYENVNNKLDKLMDKQEQILIELQNKENRK